MVKLGTGEARVSEGEKKPPRERGVVLSPFVGIYYTIKYFWWDS